MKNYVTIDIGGTTIKYGVLDEKGTFLIKDQRKTEAQKGGAEILNKVIQIIEGIQCDHHIDGICISTAGMVDPVKGKVFYSGPLIPGYTGMELKKELEEIFFLPCEVENDVNCAGLAESISGAAKDSRVTLCLTVGTGIGGCILIDGQIFHGFSNSACEVGYIPMFDSDFQTLGASSVLTKKVAERKAESVDRWDGYHIFEQAKHGDQICIQAIEELTEVLGRGIANLCLVINPQIVVLGGGIMSQEVYLKRKIKDVLDRYLPPVIAGQTTLTFARHQNDAGMLGAFYHFRKKQNLF